MNLSRIVEEILRHVDEECEDLTKENYLEVLEEVHSEIGARINTVEEELLDLDNEDI